MSSMFHALFRLAVFAALVLPLVSVAQSVRWEWSPSPGIIELVYENCAPEGDPQLPNIDGVQFSFLGRSESSQTSIDERGYQTTHLIKLSYRLRTRSGTTPTIPAFRVATDKGVLPVAAVTPQSGTPIAVGRLEPANGTVWAGEVFPIKYTLDVARRNFAQLVSNPEWAPAPLTVEDWSKPEGSEVTVNAEQRAHIVYATRGYAKTPGPLAINAITQVVGLHTSSFAGFFSRAEQLSVETNQPQLTVRALPAPPADFTGAVGQFELNSKVVPQNASVGEPVTWTITVTGTGNWPDIAGLPAREVSSDFQVVQPKAKRTNAEGKIFDVTLEEDVVLVPTKPGTYTLNPVVFRYFDPKTGTYKAVSTPRATVTVTAPTSKPITVDLGTGAATPRPTEAAPPPSRAINPPAPPAAIPRDPLPGSDVAAKPLRTGTITLGLLLPAVGVLSLWLWLAWREAQRTDPVRPRREARARIGHTLAKLAHADERERSALLLAWQHDTAILWQISHAAPPATAIGDAEWHRLWQEADRALYGTSKELPTDWIARAEAAVVAQRLPALRPTRLFLPRNLFPFAAALALSATLAVGTRASDDPLVSYRGGEFAAAETSWRETINAAPTNWIARHNLSLALAQQDRTGEAFGHASAAFVQNPSDATVRWHFAQVAQKTGSAPAELMRFVRSPGPIESLAQSMSAPQWQRMIIVAGWIVAGAIAWMLLNSYGRKTLVPYASGALLMLAGLVLAAVATSAVLAYGDAAKESAVVVAKAGVLRSIPTEADTTQKTTPLAAGSLALADKTFLGWTRIAFENGQTGWVRTEEIVALWR